MASEFSFSIFLRRIEYSDGTLLSSLPADTWKIAVQVLWNFPLVDLDWMRESTTRQVKETIGGTFISYSFLVGKTCDFEMEIDSFLDTLLRDTLDVYILHSPRNPPSSVPRVLGHAKIDWLEGLSRNDLLSIYLKPNEPLCRSGTYSCLNEQDDEILKLDAEIRLCTAKLSKEDLIDVLDLIPRKNSSTDSLYMNEDSFDLRNQTTSRPNDLSTTQPSKFYPDRTDSVSLKSEEPIYEDQDVADSTAIEFRKMQDVLIKEVEILHKSGFIEQRQIVFPDRIRNRRTCISKSPERTQSLPPSDVPSFMSDEPLVLVRRKNGHLRHVRTGGEEIASFVDRNSLQRKGDGSTSKVRSNEHNQKLIRPSADVPDQVQVSGRFGLPESIPYPQKALYHYRNKLAQMRNLFDSLSAADHSHERIERIDKIIHLLLQLRLEEGGEVGIESFNFLVGEEKNVAFDNRTSSKRIRKKVRRPPLGRVLSGASHTTELPDRDFEPKISLDTVVERDSSDSGPDSEKHSAGRNVRDHLMDLSPLETASITREQKEMLTSKIEHLLHSNRLSDKEKTLFARQIQASLPSNFEYMDEKSDPLFIKRFSDVQRIVGWYSSLTSLREGREDSIAKETPLEISMFEFLRTQGMQLNDDERASLSSSSFVAEIHPCPLRRIQEERFKQSWSGKLNSMIEDALHVGSKSSSIIVSSSSECGDQLSFSQNPKNARTSHIGSELAVQEDAKESFPSSKSPDVLSSEIVPSSNGNLLALSNNDEDSLQGESFHEDDKNVEYIKSGHPSPTRESVDSISETESVAQITTPRPLPPIPRTPVGNKPVLHDGPEEEVEDSLNQTVYLPESVSQPQSDLSELQDVHSQVSDLMSSRRSKLDSQNKDDIEREKDSPTCLLPRPRVHRIPAPIAPPVSSPLTDENITSLNPSVLSVSPPEVLPSSSESSPPSHPRLMIEIDSTVSTPVSMAPSHDHESDIPAITPPAGSLTMRRGPLPGIRMPFVRSSPLRPISSILAGSIAASGNKIIPEKVLSPEPVKEMQTHAKVDSPLVQQNERESSSPLSVSSVTEYSDDFEDP